MTPNISDMRITKSSSYKITMSGALWILAENPSFQNCYLRKERKKENKKEIKQQRKKGKKERKKQTNKEGNK